MLGVTNHGDDEEDDNLQTFRRLLAMAGGPGKENVIIGYNPNRC